MFSFLDIMCRILGWSCRLIGFGSLIASLLGILPWGAFGAIAVLWFGGGFATHVVNIARMWPEIQKLASKKENWPKEALLAEHPELVKRVSVFSLVSSLCTMTAMLAVLYYVIFMMGA